MGRGGWRRGSSPNPSGGVTCSAWPRPPFINGSSLPAACSVRAVWQPRALGAAGPAAGGSVLGGGWLVRRSSSGARPGGPAGQGAGMSLCCGPSLRPPRAGTKAGRFVIAPPSILHWRTSVCRCPVAAHWALATGTAGEGGRLTRGTRRTAACAAAVPTPRVWRPCRAGGGLPPGPAGGVRGSCPPGRPPAVRGSGGERGGGGGVLPVVPLWSPGAAPRWPPGSGLVVPAPGSQPLPGGGCTPLLLLLTLRALGRRAGPCPGPPLPSLPSFRCVVPVGGGGRVRGLAVWVGG